MSRHIELQIDVTIAANLGETARIAASIVLPDPDRLPDAPIVCFAKAPAGYSRAYYTAELPGPGSGAQASWHAEHGWIFAAIDLLGCGSSSKHDAERLDYATLTAAAVAAEQEILLRLANGVLIEGYPPIYEPLLLGIGHSLGASLVIYQQARHLSYDGIGILGFSAVHSHPPTGPGDPPIVVAWYPRDTGLQESQAPLNTAELAAAMAEGRQQAAWKSLTWGFHYDDVPRQIVEDDLSYYEAIATNSAPAEKFNAAPWKSYSTPKRAARSTLTPGVVAVEAAAIAVPVLSVMGERDLVVTPHSEMQAFKSARSFDVFICPCMGHMHNFAGTRSLLWQRVHQFGEWCQLLHPYYGRRIKELDSENSENK